MFIHAPFVLRQFVAATIGLLLFMPTAQALDFDWDGGAGTNLWDSVIISGGVQTNWVSDAIEDVPDGNDRITLSGDSLAGPVTIDLNGNQEIIQISKASVAGDYTLGTSIGGDTLTTLLISGNVLANASSDGDLIVNANIEFEVGESLKRFNSGNGDDNSQRIIVNGNVSPSATAVGEVELSLTSTNKSTGAKVIVNGNIADGPLASINLIAGVETAQSQTVTADHAGEVSVTGDNTFTGSVHVTGGTLIFDSIQNAGSTTPNALGTPSVADSAISVGDSAITSGTLRYVGSSALSNTSDRDIHIASFSSAATIEASGTVPLVLSGDITSVSSTTTRSLFLGGTNTGDNTLSGRIFDGAGSGVLNVRKTDGSKWTLTGSSPSLDGSITAAEGELVLTGSIGSTTANAGAFQTNNAGEFTLDGGYLAVSNFSKSPNGVINFQSGTVRVTAASNSSTYTGALDIGIDGAGTLQLQGGTKAFDNVIVNGADDELEISAGTYDVESIDNSNGGTFTFTGGEINLTTDNQGLTTGAGTITGKLSGLGDVTKVGAGTLTINSNTHDHSGKLNVNAGTVEVAAGGRLSDGATVNVASGATLRFLTTSGDAIFGLEGAGHVDIGDAGLVIGNSSGPGSSGGVGTFTGTLTDGPGPAIGSLEKRGLGTFAFAGTSTHSGFTEVENGVMIVTGDINNTSSVSVPNGPLAGAGRLIIDGGNIISQGKVTADQAGARLDINSGSLTASQIDVVAGTAYNSIFTWTSGNIQLTGAGGVNVGVAASSDQPFQNNLDLVTGKTLEIDNATTVGASGTLTVNGGTLRTGTLVNDAGGTFEFNAGTLSFTQDTTFDAASFKKLDVDGLIGAAKVLEVTAQATIDVPLVLAGGTMRFGTVVNPENLILDSGTLEVTGGDLEIANGTSIDTTSGMTLNVTNGALNVAAGAELNGINTTINTTAGINNSGDVNLINSTVNGGLVNDTGGSANLLGSNTFGGDLLLTSSSNLFLDIGGENAGEFDMVNVFGNSNATLDGQLNVSLAGGFAPTAGQSFTVLTASAVTDNGLTLTGPAADLFSMTITSTSVILEALHQLVLFGDADNNLVVSGSDLLAVTNNFGNTGPADGLLLGDADDNGSVSGSDLLAVTNNFGATLPGSLASATGDSAPVPEPGAALLLLATLTCWATIVKSGKLTVRT